MPKNDQKTQKNIENNVKVDLKYKKKIIKIIEKQIKNWQKCSEIEQKYEKNC